MHKTALIKYIGETGDGLYASLPQRHTASWSMEVRAKTIEGTLHGSRSPENGSMIGRISLIELLAKSAFVIFSICFITLIPSHCQSSQKPTWDSLYKTCTINYFMRSCCTD